MSRFSGKTLSAVASAIALTATPVAAQTVTRIVAFGDSYADDGNFFELTGIPRPAVYANGRFSDGTNFIDTLAQLLNAPVDNFAIGGAFTGPGNTGFFNINGPGIPGFPAEYQSYLAGGGPAAFPRVSGTFAPTDLVAISIGGNDARYYEQHGGTVAGAPAAAAISVAEATAGLNALADAGARNILFLAGDVGRLPEVKGKPIAAIGSAFATSFNAGMQASLADLAARGVIVNYLDLNKIGDVVEANLDKFGLISAGACPIACVTTDPSLLSKYLFYVDQVHLTSAGFAIVGRYAFRQLEAPLQFQAQTDAGLQAATSFASTMTGRLDLSDARNGGDGAGLRFFVTGSTASIDQDRTLTNLPYDVDTVGVTAGAEYDNGAGAIFGAALNYSRPKADMNTGSGSVKADAYQAGLYAGWSGANAFAEGYAGYGRVDYRIDREAVIDRIRGDADGDNVFAGAKAGYLFGLNGWRIGPVAGLHYARAKIDAFTEKGDPVLTLNVGKQELETLTGDAGIEARGSFESAGLAVQPYVTLAAEKDFEGDGRTIRYAGTASPTIVNSFVLPDRSKKVYGRLTGGADISLGGSIALQLNATTSFEREGHDDLGGFVGVRVGF